MKLKLVGKSCRPQCLALAAALLSVLLYYTPALNLTYRYIDSKGFIHIENFSLPQPPAQEARQSLSPVNKSETAASAVQSTPGSTADSSRSINRVVDREGIIRITSAAESAPLVVKRAGRQENSPASGVVGQTPGTPAVPPVGAVQSPIYALIAKNAGAGIKTSQPDLAKAPPRGIVGPGAIDPAGSETTGVYTPLEPSCQIAFAQADSKNGIGPMALCVDQQGKMYYYHPQVVAGDDSFWNAPIISWEKTAGQDSGRSLAAPPKAAIVSRSVPVAPASVPPRINSLAPNRQAMGRSLAMSAGKIRIYRDGRGYTHIMNNTVNENFAAQRPPEPVLAAISSSNAGSWARLSAVMPPPGTSRIIPHCPAGLDAAFNRVVSFKDKSGRLVICNRQGKISDSLPPDSDVDILAENANVDLETVMAGAAQQYRLPLSLVKAIVRAESGFVPRAVSWKGAMGLMQLMPATAACLGVKDPFCPQQNIMGGCRYFRDLLDKLHGSVPLSLAAYNAGLQRVINAGYEVPAIAETQNFVEKVIKYFFIYLQQDNIGSKI
jgi:soluble lytic murein transglycosylase-like protein